LPSKQAAPKGHRASRFAYTYCLFSVARARLDIVKFLPKPQPLLLGYKPVLTGWKIIGQIFKLDDCKKIINIPAHLRENIFLLKKSANSTLIKYSSHNILFFIIF
jgi:hypothetical protein